MESPYWKTIGRLALLVSITAGLVLIRVNSNKVPPMYLTSLAGVAIAIGVIGLVLDFKPWRWRMAALTAEPGQSQEEKILLGAWSVEKTGKDYVAKRTFRPDGRALAEAHGYGRTHVGEWRFEETCVRIIWESLIPPENREHCWETLLRPITATCASGDSWQGIGIVRAQKL
jgi:hypothetical protein